MAAGNCGKQSGFTLIELLVTIAVVIILATIAVPNFSSFIDRAKISAGVNDTVKAMNMAKIEAVKRNENITIVVEEVSLTIDSGRAKITLPSGITLSYKFTGGDITYRPNGWLVESGKLCLFYKNTLSREISVSPSGLIRIEDAGMSGCS